MRVRLIQALGIAGVLALSPVGFERGESQEYRLSVGVKLVSLHVSVRDVSGRTVTTLTKEDFIVLEDGQPQPLKHFSRDAENPLAIALAMDVSASQAQLLDEQRDATGRFIEEVLRPKTDSALLMSFGEEVAFHKNLTSSNKELIDGVKSIKQRRGRVRLSERPRGRCGFQSTLLFDGIVAASRKLAKAKQSRRALIVLSDGVDNGSCETGQSAAEAAQRADVSIYALLMVNDTKVLQKGGWPNGAQVLERITKQTGGRSFVVRSGQLLDEVYQLIQDELRTQYSLGYAPVRRSGSGEYRKITVQTRQSTLLVQSREGYFFDPEK